MCRSLSLISYNVANLKSKLVFSNFFSYITDFDVIFLFETHVTSESKHLFLNYFRDFELFWDDATKTHRAGRASGGCVFAYKKNLAEYFSPKFLHFHNNVCLSVKINNDNCLLIPRYLNCNHWAADFDAFDFFINDLKTEVRGGRWSIIAYAPSTF